MKAAALVAIVLLSACGGAPVAGNSSPSPASSASPVTSPTPVLGACNPCLALVTLRGSDHVVVRDITDINHPMTIADLGPISGASFISATELSIVTDGGLYRAPLSGSPRTRVPGLPADTGGVWSPDGSSLVYATSSNSDSSAPMTVHLLRGGVDKTVGSTPSLGVGGCEYIASCTLPNWLDSRLTFSPDGASFSFVAQGFGASFFRVWSADGTLLKSDDTQVTTFSAWSGQSLYYRDQSGVEGWRAGVASTLLPKVAWIKPSASPAGGMIVYTVRDSGGWGHVRVVDTVTGKVRELKSARTDALFLTSRYILYRGERACTAADQCGAHPPFHPENGKTYIYDLETGTEYGSIITRVLDVWPHAA